MFEAGSTIIKEGDQGSRFYIINEGHVRVTKKMEDGTDRELAVLKENVRRLSWRPFVSFSICLLLHLSFSV